MPDIPAEAAIRAEEHARIIATLQRAAEGRREYAKVLPEGHHGRETLETEAWAYESAVALIEDPINIVGLIPLWMWTAEEEAFIRSREAFPAGERSDGTAPKSGPASRVSDEPHLSGLPLPPERSEALRIAHSASGSGDLRQRYA
ncbi:hypothetical protein AB0C10_37495, partial [Microbispora amethystogenes]|uniref:hypothetical protein n=1 Tax=Microbispora amethystogenes TaxID=1427754 RepID=UPI0033D57649